MIVIPEGIFESWAEYLIMSPTKVDIIIHDGVNKATSRITVETSKKRLITGFSCYDRSNDCKTFMDYLEKEIRKTKGEEWEQWIRSKKGIKKFKL